MKPIRLVETLQDSPSKDLGVEAWSLYIVETQHLALGIKDRQAGNAHAPLTLSESCGARYLFVWDNGQISRGFLEHGQLMAAPLQTLQTTRLAAYDDPDAAYVLGPAEMPEVSLHDSAVAALAQGNTALLAERLETVRDSIDTERVRTWSGAFSASERSARIITSTGLDAAAQGTTASWFVTVNGEIGSGFAARRHESGTAFEARLERLLTLAAELEHKAEPVAAGSRRILLHPRVVDEFVLGTLLGHLSGAAVAHGESRFRVEQFRSAEPVMREDLRLHLDPLQPLKSGSYRFTSAGLPAAPCTLIEDGCLIQPVLDLKYARRLGLEPTPVPYAMDVLQFSGAATLSLNEALQAAAGGALIFSVLGIHAQDSASGDFSLAAPLALRIESGGFAGRFRATLSGNLFDLLASPDLEFVDFEGEHSPGLLVSCRLDPA